MLVKKSLKLHSFACQLLKKQGSCCVFSGFIHPKKYYSRIHYFPMRLTNNSEKWCHWTRMSIMFIKKRAKLHSVAWQLLKKRIHVPFFQVSMVHPKKYYIRIHYFPMRFTNNNEKWCHWTLTSIMSIQKSLKLHSVACQLLKARVHVAFYQVSYTQKNITVGFTTFQWDSLITMSNDVIGYEGQ